MRRVIVDLSDTPAFTAEELAAIDALTPEQIEENARNDQDNPPLTDEEFRRMDVSRSVRDVRGSRGMTQTDFAQTYRIALSSLRDWELGRSEPDAMALAYLETIRHEPEAVARALTHSRDAA